MFFHEMQYNFTLGLYWIHIKQIIIFAGKLKNDYL